MPILKKSLSQAPVKHLDNMDVIELFEGHSDKFGIAMIDLKGSHGKNINDISDKAYFVLEGKGQVIVGNEMVDVKPMDIVFIPPNVEYGIKGDLKFLCIMSPPFDPAHDRETGNKL